MKGKVNMETQQREKNEKLQKKGTEGLHRHGDMTGETECKQTWRQD